MQQKEMIMQRHDGNGDVKTWQKREAARFSPADANKTMLATYIHLLLIKMYKLNLYLKFVEIVSPM